MPNNHTGNNFYANEISGTLQSFSEKKMSFRWGGLLGNNAQRIEMSKFELQSVLICAFDARCLPAYKRLSERVKRASKNNGTLCYRYQWCITYHCFTFQRKYVA